MHKSCAEISVISRDVGYSYCPRTCFYAINIPEVKSKETKPNLDANLECDEKEKGIYQQLLSKSAIETDAKDELPSEEELEYETFKILKFDFNKLMTAVRLSLQRREVSVESLLCHLRSIEAIGPNFKPVYVGHSQPLLAVAAREFQSLGEVFVALAPYCSWFNHLIVENIIETFCEGDEELEKKWVAFKETVTNYCKRRVIDCPEDQYGEGDSSTARKAVVMKVDCHWNSIKVSQLFDIRDSVAKVLNIKRCNLYLRTVQNGCVKLLFYVPDCVELDLPLSLKVELQKVGIIDLFYDTETLSIKSLSAKLQKRSPITRSDTTRNQGMIVYLYIMHV